jgi:glucose/arabinose dehydrogenase
MNARVFFAITVLFGMSGSVCMPTLMGGDPRLDKIQLPPGFKISIWATVKNARGMCRGANGTVFVGSRDGGTVTAVRDTNHDGKADEYFTVASGLDMPVGVTMHDGDLYVSSVHRIVRVDDVEDHLSTPPKPIDVFTGFPHETHHGWKYIAFGPDGKLYVPVGAPCNICESDSIYATITRLNADGTGLEIVARGVRNSVGFDWDPRDNSLWFTDNGRDMMGDDMPSCELDHLTVVGQHFGYPYCHQGDTLDPKFGAGKSCADYVPPVVKVGPHMAPLGMKFYRGSQFPNEYRNAIFICEHGSWNRSTPIGYRVDVVQQQADGSWKQEVFAGGWLAGSSAWGRPVDVLELPDGSLLVSDDEAGLVYRISYAP